MKNNLKNLFAVMVLICIYALGVGHGINHNSVDNKPVESAMDCQSNATQAQETID